MRRLVIVTVLVAVACVFAGSATRAHHGAPYSANVREGLRWLKDNTTDGQFRAAYRLWENESGWAVHAGTLNTCYGIPQACPGWKMIEAFPRALWRAQAQVKWGTRYVRARYGTFRRALAHQNAHGWY
jgi:hypothetical protein